MRYRIEHFGQPWHITSMNRERRERKGFTRFALFQLSPAGQPCFISSQTQTIEMSFHPLIKLA